MSTMGSSLPLRESLELSSVRKIMPINISQASGSDTEKKNDSEGLHDNIGTLLSRRVHVICADDNNIDSKQLPVLEPEPRRISAMDNSTHKSNKQLTEPEREFLHGSSANTSTLKSNQSPATERKKHAHVSGSA